MIAVALLDEWASGLPSSWAFALEADLRVTATQLAISLWVVPPALSVWLEPAVLLWAERLPRVRVIAAGVAGMGLAMLGAALAGGPLGLALAFTLYFPCSGVACGTARALLVESQPEQCEANLLRWNLAGYLGDLGAPGLLWLTVTCGGGFRGAWVSMAALLFVVATALAAPRFAARGQAPTSAAASDAPTAGAPWYACLRRALGERTLVVWLAAATLCGIMDELLDMLVGMQVHAASGDVVSVAQALLAFSVGGCVGLLGSERLLVRHGSAQLLSLCCGASLASYGLWLVLPQGPWRLLALACTGALVAPQHPLVEARAFASLPERSMLVAAAGQAFGALELALPVLFGLVADHAGVFPALVLALAQPLGILVCVRLARGWRNPAH